MKLRRRDLLQQNGALFLRLEPGLTLDERDRDRRRLALAWALTGAFARGETLLGTDSSVASFDVRGRIHALAGELATAGEWLRLAGPYDDERLHAVERVQLLALIKAIGRDTLPAFGGALTALERGDTAAAIPAFVAVAAELEPPGAAAIRLFASDLAAARADSAQALVLAAAADTVAAPASAPSARLRRARLMAAQGDTGTATGLLESLILEFPESAVVPEARRMRDVLRGRLPPGALE